MEQYGHEMIAKQEAYLLEHERRAEGSRGDDTYGYPRASHILKISYALQTLASKVHSPRRLEITV